MLLLLPAVIKLPLPTLSNEDVLDLLFITVDVGVAAGEDSDGEAVGSDIGAAAVDDIYAGEGKDDGAYDAPGGSGEAAIIAEVIVGDKLEMEIRSRPDGLSKFPPQLMWLVVAAAAAAVVLW